MRVPWMIRGRSSSSGPAATMVVAATVMVVAATVEDGAIPRHRPCRPIIYHI